MKTFLFVFLITCNLIGQAQSLTLEDCYSLTAQNYPLVKQRELIIKSSEYSMQNLSKGYLPQFSINGQATYQSEVTQIPIRIPGNEIPTLSKDQYKVYGEINQTVFDGGVIRLQKQAQEYNALMESQKLEVELYKLRERINQVFFGVLLADEQLKQSALVKNDIELGVRKTEAALANGTAFKNSLDILKAELLKVDQRAIELNAMRKAYIDMLGLFVNRELNELTILQRPVSISPTSEINRPEMLLYAHQRESVTVQDRLLAARNLPKVSFFVQGGYGRPALNFLNNDFKSYYIGGIRLSWSLSGLYTIKGDKALLDLNRKNIALQQETFLFNASFTLKQQNAEVNKYTQLVETDDEIVTLRSTIKNTASVQLENGVINPNDYLREVSAEDQARQTKIVHEIQLLMAQYAQQNTTGNSHL